MELDLRPMKPQECSYSQVHSDQRMEQSGLIGILRAELDNTGTSFFSNWTDNKSVYKVPAFRDEIDTVLDMLKYDERYGHILKNNSSMIAYGWANPSSQVSPGNLVFRFRADTANYSYMLRLDPQRLRNNVQCFCYSRDVLDRHIKRAQKGIRFENTKRRTLFTLPDGDLVRIIGEDGRPRDYPCFFVEEDLIELRTDEFKVLQAQELIDAVERNNAAILPILSSLPEKCFGVDPETSKMVVIIKGVSGVKPAGAVPIGVTPQEGVDAANDAMGVTRAQAAAMLAGAIHGWDRPEADPKNYDRNGRSIKPKSKEDMER